MFHYIQILKLYLCVFSTKKKKRRRKRKKEGRKERRKEGRKEGRKERKEILFLCTPNITIKIRTLTWIHYYQ